MVSDVGLSIMEGDENRDAEVVIRKIQGDWWISHAKSYQNAFSSDVNGFVERDDAVEFAENHDCTVIFHSYDRLQSLNNGR